MDPDRYLRTFDLLDLLVRHRQGMRLTEIKDALNLPASSVHNMLQTMVTAEVATVTEDLRYMVGPRAVSLALATIQSLDIRSISRRYVQDLAREIGDDIYLALQVGSRVFYADRAMGNNQISLDIRLGEALYLHSTATGKLFAAHDPKLAAKALSGRLPKLTPSTITSAEELEREYQRIREAGYASSREESVDGVVGYAIPVRHADGSLAAALHASVIAKLATKNHERKLLAAARECATQIERQLGHGGNGQFASGLRPAAGVVLPAVTERAVRPARKRASN
ncbi:IclR family transcriptional regulator [Variovorax sp. J31P207]|uniref:IclR family transcriptional regulator n=1 Tax=Variovorax sp. J31P207 TaxID=3053510 RepID=UPI002575C9D9|nr:IclR family transcriptional regulator [Variovorax sp. J31P207]MDM0069955.1 IclR family transcriptional regulator [Variovorax sp. J31P207]